MGVGVMPGTSGTRGKAPAFPRRNSRGVLLPTVRHQGVLLVGIPCYAPVMMKNRDAEIRAQLQRQWAEVEVGGEVQWEHDLIWCPSQCSAHIVCQGVDYVLYLRWRWDDPWQGHIITHARGRGDLANTHAVWSEDLLEQRGLFFRDEELDQAKAALVRLFLEQTAPPSSQ